MKEFMNLLGTNIPGTTWQTVGPFFQIGLEHFYLADIADEGVTGERIRIEGCLLDGDGAPIPDALIEIWQANSYGKYAHPGDTQDKPLEQGFRGFGRIATDDNGCFRFSTIKPGLTPGPNGTTQAPHLVVSLVMRGLLRGLVTRAYFADNPNNDSDPVLQLVEQERRSTLMLKPSQEAPTILRWTIHVQGENETVFFDF
jgi:protocatechuate 3,4-dioxygenase alpha subunit